ncbi:alkene reductase [Sporosarcina sp. BP05]|uniref:oxidoreductase n=1 Tax=Sporosarcina sp. BP05 TaxID=2758726 RepID=UPI00351C7001
MEKYHKSCSRGRRPYFYTTHACNVGRISHPDNTPHHRQPVAPSAIAPEVKMFTAEGMKDAPTPRAFSKDEINEVIQEFRTAASAAIEAGADGVEIHGANGYLIHQFLSENSNQRNDEYGSTIENGARFAIEVTKAVVDEIGADKTGFRLSPSSTLHDIEEGEFGPDVYRYLIAELEKLDLAYLHVMHVGNEPLLKDIRQIWSNPLLVNRAGRPLEKLTTDLDKDLADMVPVGTWALANPDFVERVKNNEPLNEAERSTFYGGGAEGYTNYPFLKK